MLGERPSEEQLQRFRDQRSAHLPARLSVAGADTVRAGDRRQYRPEPSPDGIGPSAERAYIRFTAAPSLITGRATIQRAAAACMAEDHIRYDILAQEALRGVMRKVLAEVARTGLPGNHHFFITFLTGAPGVRISSRLRERYPEQMTIVAAVPVLGPEGHRHRLRGRPVLLRRAGKTRDPVLGGARLLRSVGQFRARVRRQAGRHGELPTEAPAERSPNRVGKGRRPAKKAEPRKKAEAKTPKTAGRGGRRRPKGADVVSLDAFRKK